MRHSFRILPQLDEQQPPSAGGSMPTTYRLVRCRSRTGERYCLLVDAETGLPPWWPTLFITTQLRNASKSLATMETALRSIQILLAYADEHGISIEDRVLARENLALHEIDALCDWAQRSFDRRPRNGREDRLPMVSKAQHYTRLSWVAEYIGWFARTALNLTPDDHAAIERVVKSILARRPRRGRGALLQDRALTAEQCHRLLDVVRPDHPDNPFGHTRPASQRNELMIHLLLELGIRRGELLGIQVGDIDWQGLSLTIHRRADDPHDPRTDQPRAKTLARKLPLSPDLTERISGYVFGARRQTKGSGAHRYLIVAHCKGPYQGQPLSHPGLAKVFAALGRCDPLLTGLSPHLLRHTWNWKFSKALDALPAEHRPKHPQEGRARSHLMGWQPGSGTAEIYNGRHTVEQANKAAQKLYEKAVPNRHPENSRA